MPEAGDWWFVGMAPDGPILLGPFTSREAADNAGDIAASAGISVRTQDIFTRVYEAFER